VSNCPWLLRQVNSIYNRAYFENFSPACSRENYGKPMKALDNQVPPVVSYLQQSLVTSLSQPMGPARNCFTLFRFLDETARPWHPIQHKDDREWSVTMNSERSSEAFINGVSQNMPWGCGEVGRSTIKASTATETRTGHLLGVGPESYGYTSLLPLSS
jgi:hypothetical protein